MAKRDRPVVVSTRVLHQERALIRALAEAEGATVSQTLHRLLMPAVRDRLAELAESGKHESA